MKELESVKSSQAGGGAGGAGAGGAGGGKKPINHSLTLRKHSSNSSSVGKGKMKYR